MYRIMDSCEQYLKEKQQNGSLPLKSPVIFGVAIIAGGGYLIYKNFIKKPQLVFHEADFQLTRTYFSGSGTASATLSGSAPGADGYDFRIEKERQKREADEKEEDLRRADFEKKLKKDQESFEQTLRTVREEEEALYEVLRVRKQESEEMIQKMIEDGRREHALKDKVAALEIELHRLQGNLEIQKIRDARQESHKVHQEEVSQMDEQFQINRRKYESEDEIRRHEILELQFAIQNSIEQKYKQELLKNLKSYEDAQSEMEDDGPSTSNPGPSTRNQNNSSEL